MILFSFIDSCQQFIFLLHMLLCVHYCLSSVSRCLMSTTYYVLMLHFYSLQIIVRVLIMDMYIVRSSNGSKSWGDLLAFGLFLHSLVLIWLVFILNSKTYLYNNLLYIFTLYSYCIRNYCTSFTRSWGRFIYISLVPYFFTILFHFLW